MRGCGLVVCRSHIDPRVSETLCNPRQGSRLEALLHTLLFLFPDRELYRLRTRERFPPPSSAGEGCSLLLRLQLRVAFPLILPHHRLGVLASHAPNSIAGTVDTQPTSRVEYRLQSHDIV